MEEEKTIFSAEAKDEELLTTFVKWKKESEQYHNELLKYQKISEQYYLGNQTSRDRIPDYLSNTVENRIFEAVETIVPVVTAAAHSFQVMPGSKDEKSIQRADKLQKLLRRKYETLLMQEKLEEITRHLLLYRFGVLKVFWNKKIDDLDVKVIDPRLMYFPKLRVKPNDLPYKMEVQEYTQAEFEEEFPDADPNALIKEMVDTGSNEKNERIHRLFEIWTPDTVAWIGGGVVVKKMQTPYYDYEGEEQPEGSATPLKFYNHFDLPRDPYIIFTTYNVSEGPVGAVSLAEVAIPIQDAINVQKRQIIDNLRRLGNGRMIIDSEAMSEEEAGNITDEPGGYILGKGAASEGRVKVENGIALSNAHFANLTHSENVFDNVTGVHSATRGAAAAKTLGQDILSRQQDFTRIDLITRVLNRGVDETANWIVQLVKLFYTENHVVKMIGEQEAVEFVELNRTDVDDFIEIIVKSGADLPMDRVSLRTEAVQLWQLGALDPVTLFERLGFAEPSEVAQKLLAWKQGQLSMETNARIQEAQAGAAVRAQTPTSEATRSAGRGTETPANVLQRARANVGGTAPTR